MSAHPSIPEDVAALITAHALGALEPDQAALAEEHIAASDACRRAYEDALETAAALALAVADSEPSADLRDRIVAAARAERAGRARGALAPRRAAGCRLAGLLTPSGGFAARASPRPSPSRSSRSRSTIRPTARATARQALVAILAAPDARVVPMLPSGGGAAEAASSSGRAVPPS